jgi:Fic family protein
MDDRSASHVDLAGSDLAQFTYARDAISAASSRARLAQGVLLGKAAAIEAQELPLTQRDVWAEEAVATAAIEGEALDLTAVRSSVARRLGITPTLTAPVPRNVEALLDVMEDATAQWATDLTEERLCRWQAALFASGLSSLRRIETSRYRTQAEPMQIVSGLAGKETVHYEAPASSAVAEEMGKFLTWFNRTRDETSVDGIVRAAISHVWFESIHPFEDGNGRIGRAIVDMALAQDARLPNRLLGMAARMRKDQVQYYEMLNRAQRGTGDITEWLLWFIEAFALSCQATSRLVDESLARARFWSEHRDTPINERQRKALNRMLEAGPGRFEGGMTTRKYQSLTGAIKITASRDLAELAGAGLLVRQGAGRSTFYNLPMPGWAWSPPAARRSSKAA